jgi:hypothetical protein
MEDVSSVTVINITIKVPDAEHVRLDIMLNKVYVLKTAHYAFHI